MNAPTPPPEAKTSRPAESVLQLARFFAVVAALGVAAFLAAAAIVWFVPEQNDYALATLRKHELLAHAPDRRMVLVGGSNLAFGIDSGIIEEESVFTPVNMGMNGYFGVRYMLAEVRPHVRAGDVVVIAFEWDNYFKSIEGDSTDLLIVSKANPDALRYLTWSQRARVLLRGVPYVAQQKVLRLMRQGVEAMRRVVRGGRAPDEAFELVSDIERASGFTPAGDLISHLGVEWPYPREQGIDLTAADIDPEVVGYIQAFAREMEGRGVRVIVSYTPVLRAFYDQHAGVIDAVHARMNADGAVLAPRAPHDYVYDESLFFDTVYHLNAAGRGPRTRQLIGDVNGALAPAPQPPRSLE